MPISHRHHPHPSLPSSAGARSLPTTASPLFVARWRGTGEGEVLRLQQGTGGPKSFGYPIELTPCYVQLDIHTFVVLALLGNGEAGQLIHIP